MVYLFSRTNIPKNKTIKHNSGVVTGLEPCDSPKCSLECPHILTLAYCVHYHHYPSLQIVMEKRLHFTKHLLQAGCSSLLSIHVILLPIEAGDSLCVPTIDNLIALQVLLALIVVHGLGTMTATLLSTIYHVSVDAPSS